MLMKKPRHRLFDYPPRFYKPEDDEKEKKKRKLGFSRQRKFKHRKRSPVFWIVLLMFIVYLLLKLNKAI